MNIHDLLRAAADRHAHNHGTDDTLTEALARWEGDPREHRRINDLADLLDAQDALYDEALAALDRDDLDAAQVLVRQCLDLDIEGADELQRMLSVRRAAAQGVLSDPPSTTASWTPLDDWDDQPQPQQPVLRTGAEFAAAAGTWLKLNWAHHGDLGLPALITEVKHRERLGLISRSGLLTHGVSPDFVFYLASHCSGQDRPAVLVVDFDRARECSAEWWGRSWAQRIRHDEPCVTKLLLHSPSSAGTGLVVGMLAACRSRLARADVGTYIGTEPEPEPRRAADVLAPYPFTYLPPDTPLREALDQLLGDGESALPVREAGMVVGTVALVDLVEATRDGTSDQPVSTMMRKPVFAKATMPIDEVRDLLIQDSAGLVTVVDDDGTVAGHITPVTALAGHTSTPSRTSPRSSSGLITADLEDLLC